MSAQDSPLGKGTVFRNAVWGKARCEIGWNWHPRPLSDYDLWYVVAGSGEFRLDGAVHRLAKGSCALIRPGDRPHAEQDPDNRLTVIFVHFRIEGAEADEGGAPLLPPRFTRIEDTYAFELLLNRLLETLDRREPWFEAEFDCIMRQIFLRLYRAHSDGGEQPAVSNKQRRAVERVSALIREEGGKRIAHEKLAAEVGLSPQYLSVLFKKCNGISLKEYITQVRLERAMHLLTETTMNVSQVAEVLGYANLFLFSKQFKQKFGYPPSRFSMKSVPPKPHGK